MNHDEHPNDSVLTRELRDSLSQLATPKRPPLAAITNRGRAHRRRRLTGFAGLGGAGVAVGAALALGLTGVLGAAPARGTSTTADAAPARSAGTIRTAAFTLTRNANGTVTLRLTSSQMFDPTVLQQALAQDGIPALVKTDTYCSSNPAPPDPMSIGVLTHEINGIPLKPPQPVKLPAKGVPAETGTVINPAAMPSGTKLFFSYFNSDTLLFSDLIYASSYTCSNAEQPPATS
jgi:hypothetical protein